MCHRYKRQRGDVSFPGRGKSQRWLRKRFELRAHRSNNGESDEQPMRVGPATAIRVPVPSDYQAAYRGDSAYGIPESAILSAHTSKCKAPVRYRIRYGRMIDNPVTQRRALADPAEDSN